MSELQRTISPVDGSVLVERPLAGAAALDRALHRAVVAQRAWRAEPLDARLAAVGRFVDAVMAGTDQHADEITWQMGRPRTQAPGELAGFADRARTMLTLAPEALADLVLPAKAGFTRSIRREPVGVVLVLAPWNYPWLTAVNTIVPALAAGNAVLLKHSDQTPLVAERLTAAAEAALPDGLLQHVHASHERIADVVRDPRVAFVAFTGSVAGGHAVHAAAGGTFTPVGLELGGKDAGYVRADADPAHAAAGLIDGAMFNAGQSCCGIERIFVHRSRYEAFVEAAKAEVEALVLGDPTDAATTLGPVVRARNAEAILAQVDAAISGGARDVVDPGRFDTSRGLPYLAPRVLVDVDPKAAVQREETFGPVVTITPVDSDDEAVQRINDSPYGLTSAIFTPDLDTVAALAGHLDVGTVFANRCDALDPELAWVGVKDSGRGCTLSVLGYDALTRPKSLHLKHLETP